MLPASGGDALVYGESLQSAGGMDRIRAMMGVCPQFDILWNELTGSEHLWIYANVKGISRANIKQQSAALLDQVCGRRAHCQPKMNQMHGTKFKQVFGTS